MDHMETSSLTAQFAARCANMTFATLPASARALPIFGLAAALRITVRDRTKAASGVETATV